MTPLSSGVLALLLLSLPALSPLFLAVIEAAEEAILNSLWAARTERGKNRTVEELPRERVGEWLRGKEN